MKLPENSLGISDAIQFHECPKLFLRNMSRHTRSEGALDETMIGGHSEILAYGSCVHDAALIIAENPEIYLDDAVDQAWKKWAAWLSPERHAELREDAAVVQQRSIEAMENLELVCAEQELKVPIFVGRGEEGGLDEEEGIWYYYRFRIDALYRRKDDPTHYVIRDFKTTRRQKFQSDIDEDMQFTAYDYGVREAFGKNVNQVTIWYDQLKHGEIFSSRTERDRIKFQEYIESTIKAVLDTPVEVVAETYHLNEWCSWCPLLDSCGVIDHVIGISKIDLMKNADLDGFDPEMVENMVGQYETVRQAQKALKEYADRVSDFLKNNPGTYAGKKYYTSNVRQIKWKARDVFDLVGDGFVDKLPLVSSTALKEYLNNPDYADELTALGIQGGYEKLSSRKVSDDDSDSNAKGSS